jgi:hypothetical protein
MHRYTHETSHVKSIYLFRFIGFILEAKGFSGNGQDQKKEITDM